MRRSIKPAANAASHAFETWNRKLHFYLGLYFLFFLWLFSLTGLLLNHGRWLAAAFERRETHYERAVVSPAGETDIQHARDLMRQLDLKGEIELPAAQQPRFFAFNVSRPRDANQVRVNLGENKASIQHFDNSHWAAFRILHTFSGWRYNQPASNREWIVTRVWVFAMDALAAGLIVMVLSSYYMWYKLKPKRRMGLIVLAAGFLGCAAFFATFIGFA